MPDCPAVSGRLICTREAHDTGGHWFVGADVPDGRHDDDDNDG